ncbi:M42 family metallopeptidase [Brevibacillus fluminis]|uniref:M42 family metallopeptidase n=1 Tax=Brevibacillus fluminis TaxID=511487 RepID=UPI003F8C25CA
MTTDNLLKELTYAKERIKSFFRELTGLIGVSGAEQEVVRYLRDQLAAGADEVKIDRNGNVTAIKYGTKPGPKLMVAAHADEVGFCVKNILPNGFLAFDQIGDGADALLPGRKVWISTRNGRKITGIIGVKAGHMQTAEEAHKKLTIRDAYLDVGASSKQEAEEMGIRIGDTIVFQSDFTEMFNPDLISTKSVDNRISCAILIELFHQLKDEDFAGTLYGVVTVREEVGLHGAAMLRNAIDPDYAIVLDTIPAGDVPDIDTERMLPVYLGKGPACPIADGTPEGFFTFIHPKVREIIEAQSEAAGVPLQYLTLVGNYYTTDAAGFALANGGLPVGIIATPRRYSHSPVELVNLNDAAQVLRIVKAIVRANGEKDFSFV